MYTQRTSGEHLFIAILALTIFLPACGRTWLSVRQVPENGFEQTLNYQFQARVHSDEDNKCEQLTVEVKAINKMYSEGEPPPRLQLYDDDCQSPVRFERAQYVSKDTGEHIWLSGPEVGRFLGGFKNLENELVGWLWRAGVI